MKPHAFPTNQTFSRAARALAVALSFARGAVAEAPKPPATSSTSECFPSCREGFVCHERQCVSLCNPPCPDDQACLEGKRCEPRAPEPGAIPEPPLPRLRPFEERGFFMLGFHYGFTGTLEEEVNAITGEAELAPIFGFSLRGDVPVERYLLLGPLVQFGTWRADVTPAPNRNYYVDADLFIRGRLPLPSESTNFQIWAGVPIGITFDLLGQETVGVSGVGIGWNVGVLLGGAVHFTPKLGLFAEVGWVQHKFSHSADQSVYVRLTEWDLNVGLAFGE